MNNNLSLEEWETVANEVNELQDMLWHSANKLAKYDLYVDQLDHWTEDQKERYKKESFEFHITDGWKRLMKLKDLLDKLGMPKDLKLKREVIHKVA